MFAYNGFVPLQFSICNQEEVLVGTYSMIVQLQTSRSAVVSSSQPAAPLLIGRTNGKFAIRKSYFPDLCRVAERCNLSNVIYQNWRVVCSLHPAPLARCYTLVAGPSEENKMVALCLCLMTERWLVAWRALYLKYDKTSLKSLLRQRKLLDLP